MRERTVIPTTRLMIEAAQPGDAAELCVTPEAIRDAMPHLEALLLDGKVRRVTVIVAPKEAWPE